MKIYALIIFFSLFTTYVYSKGFSANIQNVKTKLVNEKYLLNAEFEYKLSPTAKRALRKGIPLTWIIIIKVQKLGVFWNNTIQKLETAYQIQNHTLLNLYSVKKISTGTVEMFSTLNAALNSISSIRDLPILDRQLTVPEERYQIAIKVLFDRENLPVPLRPMSYFNSNWDLSSHWSSWHLQN